MPRQLCFLLTKVYEVGNRIFKIEFTIMKSQIKIFKEFTDKDHDRFSQQKLKYSSGKKYATFKVFSSEA